MPEIFIFIFRDGFDSAPVIHSGAHFRAISVADLRYYRALAGSDRRSKAFSGTVVTVNAVAFSPA